MNLLKKDSISEHNSVFLGKDQKENIAVKIKLLCEIDNSWRIIAFPIFPTCKDVFDYLKN